MCAFLFTAPEPATYAPSEGRRPSGVAVRGRSVLGTRRTLLKRYVGGAGEISVRAKLGTVHRIGRRADEWIFTDGSGATVSRSFIGFLVPGDESHFGVTLMRRATAVARSILAAPRFRPQSLSLRRPSGTWTDPRDEDVDCVRLGGFVGTITFDSPDVPKPVAQSALVLGGIGHRGSRAGTTPTRSDRSNRRPRAKVHLGALNPA